MGTVTNSTIRSVAEIAAMANRPLEVMSFRNEVLVPYLPFEHAQQHLTEGITAEAYARVQRPLTSAAILDDITEYMTFAWTKVQDHRSLSAMRSVEKMRWWAWLLGDDDMVAVAEDEDRYPQYGAPILAALCEGYGLPIPDDEDIQRMIRGLPCDPGGCSNGCSR